MRTQFFRSAEGSKFSSAERFLSLREELPLRAKETSLAPPRTPTFELRRREKQSLSPCSICDRRGACSSGKIQR
uniref:PROTEIN G PROTEIN G OF BOVINE n=1 Tax=Myoviridae sp. ctFCq8 TaxID=2827605 RepID=A0A8S5LIJ6_9CAUD|nr:MAG TPA: PROTEIN G PROTEIN G OF BOVINE [Myoviridae sp. ctFCq8]